MLWDFYRGGPLFPRSNTDACSAERPPAGGVTRKGDICVEDTEGTLSLFGEAWLSWPAASVGKGVRDDVRAILGETLLLIPAYNEAEGVGRLLHEIKWMYPVVDILVLDDGSRDGTSGKAYAAGAAVLGSSCNRGIGEMMRGGLGYAWRRGYRFAVRLDGDGQHPPACIPALLGPLAQGEAEVTVGSRSLAGTIARVAARLPFPQGRHPLLPLFAENDHTPLLQRPYFRFPRIFPRCHALPLRPQVAVLP